jgi:hypothetical protein
MDLSFKRNKALESLKNSGHRHNSINMSMSPASIVNNHLMPSLIKADVIKKEVMEGDNISEKSDDSSDSGRLQMDISSQEDTEEYRNLPTLKPLGRDTPASDFSDEHGFDDHFLQALAQHTQSKKDDLT